METHWVAGFGGFGDRWAARVGQTKDFRDFIEGFTDGVIPRHVVASSPHFHRPVAGLITANGVRVHVAGIDLIRGDDGVYRVLEDNVRSPSGVSYVMTNRRAVNSALPEVAGKHRIRPVEDYPSELLKALRAAAPSGITYPDT